MRKSWKSSRRLAVGIAMALGCSMASVAFADQTITEPIIGPDNLSFSENVTFEVSNNLIAGGPWLPDIGAAVSASEEGTVLNIDMDGNALSVIGKNDDSGLEFNTSITGDASEDTDYVTAGVIDKDNGSYNFKENVTINSEVGALFQPSSSYTTYNKFVAPVYTAVGKDITINMNKNTLNVNHIAGNEMNASKLVGLAAGQGSSLEINDAGNINITFANEKGNNHTGALAYGGGKLIIHNGGENQEQKIFSFNGLDEAKGKRGLYAETKKSDSGEESQIIIDGLVNIVAKDTSAYGGAAVSESYAVQADSAQIDIGGGKFVGRLEAKHTYNYGDVTRINVNTQKDNDGNVIGAGDNVVQIDGDLRAKGSSKKAAQVNVGLNGADSYLRGNVIGTQSSNATLDNESAYDSTTKYGVNIYMDNGADWTGGATGALTLRMHNGATWHGGSNAEKDSDAINHMSMTLDTGAVWYHNGTHDIAVDYFTGGKDEAARGTIVMDGDKNITLSNYTGNTMVSFVRDSEYPTRVIGGNITIGSAAEGSVITLSTDNDGLDTSNAEEVTKVMNKLADKLTYTGAIEGAENNLDGYVQIAEGLTSSSAALKLGSIDFSAEDGKGSLKAGSIVTPDGQKNPGVIYGDKETAMMKGAKTAMASSALMWRAESNALMKRMGDLRLAEGESGIWAKYYGGKYSMDGQNTDLSVKYNAYQVGYDREIGNGWLAGVALSYNDGDSTYGSGRADLKGTSLGLYGTWKGDDGQYLDLIAKYTRLENEFDVRNAYGHKLSGDYKTWGASLSAEYGKRFEMDKGFYVDPSVELTLGRIAAKDYTAGSDYLDSWGRDRSLSVEQDAFTSCIGRVGVRLGQKTDTASYFVKLAAAHEFSGDFDTTFRAAGEADGRTSIDLGDTWCEAQVGLTAKLSDNNTFYASYERSFGGDVEQKYRLDAGLRWSF